MYQKYTGNPPIIHIMLKIIWEYLSGYQIEIINDLVRASIVDIVCAKEVEPNIEK